MEEGAPIGRAVGTAKVVLGTSVVRETSAVREISVDPETSVARETARAVEIDRVAPIARIVPSVLGARSALDARTAPIDRAVLSVEGATARAGRSDPIEAPSAKSRCRRRDRLVHRATRGRPESARSTS